MKLAPQQQDAYAKVTAWLRIRYAPFFYLAGFAGTGKTTIARTIAEQVNGEVRYAAYTGKAAKVMRANGCEKASTIHSLIYHPEVDEKTGQVTLHMTDVRVRNASLIVIDECSMVDEELARDLLSFDIPVLVLGDPGQLPPVKGAGFFTASEPAFMLTDVHRQAADSPIIQLATEVREGRFDGRPRQLDGLTICRKTELDPALVPAAGAVIVGRNATRERYNHRLREISGFEGDTPQVGETLICLRNDRNLKISNGETFRVKKVRRPRRTEHGRVLNFTMHDPEDPGREAFKASVYEHFFQGKARIEEIPFKSLKRTQQFDYGYAITCHKSQGSQWDDVVVFDESRFFGANAARHLYTAVTRASKNLTVVTP
ncbi:AAA family ATPase [Aurantimonas sp. DM33-3]|uniref:ATP-dependent DNA helicase n=1 Tax=Aurantimonas sp. DM33-3 TaxID=2766955 RepID=UPI0016529FDF|nr:ATP-dependent RecD-like DNA helicase [Aurantimonas sp. DM33-3]MBC6714725.1 AAA family ATPase [Aurantimonas sp. DM33-3]